MFGFTPRAKPTPTPADRGTQPVTNPAPQKKPVAAAEPVHPITGYMRGDATARRMQELGLKDGGVVRGPGTGTSDSIKTKVPAGSYIMPADSTEEIGEGALDNLGEEAAERGDSKQGGDSDNGDDADKGTPGDMYEDAGEGETDDQVPVNLSNGEYELTPEQVHAVGVQTLEQMKGATHTPTGNARGFKPETFFADGGVVGGDSFYIDEDGVKRPLTTATNRMTADSPLAEGTRARAQADSAAWEAERAGRSGPQPASAAPTSSPAARGFRAALPQKLGRSGALGAALTALPEAISVADVAGDKNSTGNDVATQAAEGVSRVAATTAGAATGAELGAAVGALGGPLAPVTVPAGALIGGTVGGGLGFWGADKAIRKGRELVGVDPSSPVDRVNAKDSVAAPVVSPAATGVAPVATTAPALPAGVAINNTSVNGVSRVDGVPGAPNLFTDNPQRAIADANSSASSRNVAAATQAQDGRLNARGFQPRGADPYADQMVQMTPGGPFVRAGDAGYTPGFASTGYADPKLTPGDRNFDPRAFAASENARQLDQRGEIANREIDNRSQQLADNRYQSDREYSLKQQESSDQSTARGFQINAAKRLERLQQQYEAAAPEQRTAIAQQIKELSGKDDPNRFTVVPGGQEIDPATGLAITRPAQVINNQTGEFVQPKNAANRPSMPKVGDIRGGHRFKGGSPADQKNWEKV